MKKVLLSRLLCALVLALPMASLAQAPNLGTAATFALFTGNGAFSNTGATTITGDVGTNVGAFTGFPPGTVTGQIRLPGSTQASQAATDVTAAYTALNSPLCDVSISPTLGNGQVFTPGVYCQNTAAASSLTGTLVLSGAGVFIIRLNSAFTVAAGAVITLTNGACADNVFFRVNGAVDVGAGAVFKGTIVADGAISLGAGATLEGRGLSVGSAISLNTNTVTLPSASCTTTTGAVSLSGTTYTDLNKNNTRDGGDTPLGGITATLIDATTSLTLATAVTSGAGLYSFTGLTSGKPYSVSFTPPAGYSASSPGVTGPVTLTAGANNPGVDAGFYVLAPALSVDLRVNKSLARPGDVLTYTLVLTNTGNAPATNVVVRDSLSAGLVYVAGSATAPPGTTFTQGTPISSLSVTSLGAGQSLSLTFQVTVGGSGIFYNTVLLGADEVRVCTTVPIKLCPGDEYVISVAAGRGGYRWYKDGVLVTGQTSNSLVVNSPGSYSLGIDNIGSGCPDFSCCPFIVEADVLPVYQAATIAATCTGTTVQQNGQLVLTGFDPTHTYQYSLGSSFDPLNSLSGPPQGIPANGLIASSLPNPLAAQLYTVRVINANGCYTDITVSLLPTTCVCPPNICVPFTLRRTKGVAVTR
ncbi:ice-binding family protein [Fibrella aquatilis]|uniref:DUF3494 domain-containing protein n=1 Tax=Fibrella aquatilis TaxID=2817059 RepID=A0A939G8X0_9BACT|nr:DUF3494 domain-containing protein [Fibrella aquatilis]